MAGATEGGNRPSGTRAYRWGVTVAIVTSLLTLWTTIVRDDGNGVGSILLVMAAAVAAFSTWFRPAGLARAMLGVAFMQLALGGLIATAPSTARLPDHGARTLLFCAIFAGLWLLAAGLFAAAYRARNRR